MTDAEEAVIPARREAQEHGADQNLNREMLDTVNLIECDQVRKPATVTGG
jgi:hypothetical protein